MIILSTDVSRDRILLEDSYRNVSSMNNDWSEKNIDQMRDFRIPSRCERYLSPSGILRRVLDLLTL